MLTRRSLAAVAAALALGTPVAAASAATSAAHSNRNYPRCPASYAGPTNLATGCPYSVMIQGPPGA
jgi:hypothetical protein